MQSTSANADDSHVTMLASPSFRLTDSPGIRGVALWTLTAAMVFVVIDGMATRPHAVHIERYREAGMTDEQLLSIALQEARASEDHVWWINDRSSYIVFDVDRSYDISDATYRAFGLSIAQDAARTPIAVRSRVTEATRASVGSRGRTGR